MKYTETPFCALVERELIWSSALNQDDNKIVNFSALAVALVARNLRGASLLLKGAVK